ncbi:MAG: polymerase LigD, ligase domain protein [Pedosphaera sp.]|nr:polymerase LigD, ligase domain protein [Pedosphaera sp.]
MSLQEYNTRRDFNKTGEPAGRNKIRRGRGEMPLFVVQKHAASRLHYDFRLAIDGVLKSWAIPKGFPTKRGERRLAVQVEDHPLDYANFEGTIAPGNYGAGTVMVWDKGTYQVAGGDAREALQSGKIHLKLDGTKLKGEWTLVRMRSKAHSDRAQWLLLKSGSSAAPISNRAEDQSALSRRSMDQIASSNGREWKSMRRSGLKTFPKRGRENVQLRAPGRKGLKRRNVQFDKEDKFTATLPRSKPGFIEPMKCELVKELPGGPDWVYEIKFDGVRAICVKTSRRISLISRSAKDLTAKYPQVAKALQQLPCSQAVLDGEIVAVDAQGRSSFQLLQAYNLPGHKKKPPILYYAFDLMNLNGRDLTGLPLTRRKEILKFLLAPITETVLFSASIEAQSRRVVQAMKSRGLEGVIAKRKDSKYEPGRRSGAWVKFKWTKEQEFVIGGFTPPQGARILFGAILVGYYEAGKLMFASKVGTGFDREMLEMLYAKFQKLIRRDCPFANLPTKRSGSGSLGLSAAQMKNCTWLEPRLVCQIRFSEWTRDGHLRQPVFLGLREDKDPREVIRETPK